ncbi:MAG: penicillin-binding protein 1A [Candidatus Sulfobium sp.]
MPTLEQDLERHERRAKTVRAIVLFLILAAVCGISGGVAYWTLSDLPRVDAIEQYAPMESSKVYSSDGKVLAEFYYERRTFVPYYKIPDHVKKAFVAIEDARFYSHSGIDFIGTMRALYHDIKARKMVEGGSTITQQLAKMLFLKPEKSIIRKVKEAILSLQIEKRYTKDEILGLYLNQTYFGSRAFGIEAASQTYFGKPVTDLSIGEAALLASLPKAPSFYSPFRNPERAKKRRSLVLREMLKHKYITKAQYKEALKDPVPDSPHYRKYEAPYFVEMLRQQLELKYGAKIYTAGYRIYSTINLKMQHIAEKAVSDGVKSVEKREKPGIQAALVAVDLRSGQIKAMVGGSDFWKNQFNRATQALRQPGSSFKPFVYATAMEEGMTPSDVVDDSPITFKGANPDQVWSPQNYEGEFNGEVTLETAMAKSLNAATVRLASWFGVQPIIKTAKRLGITSNLQPYLPIALGASDVTLLEMVHAYSALATGKKTNLIDYDRIENRDGIVTEEVYPHYSDVLSDKVVKEIRELLGAVIAEGTGRRAQILGRPVFGKTGTTNDCTDAWFIGFDDHLAVGVWVGRDNHKPIGRKETGAAAALPIWIRFMKHVVPLESR